MTESISVAPCGSCCLCCPEASASGPEEVGMRQEKLEIIKLILYFKKKLA